MPFSTSGGTGGQSPPAEHRTQKSVNAKLNLNMTTANHNSLDELRPENPKNNSEGCLRIFGLSILSSVAVLFLGLLILLANAPGPHSSGKTDYEPSTYTLAFASLIGIIVAIRYLLRKQYYQALAVILGLAPLFNFTWYYLTRTSS
jgi:hypothetical protein